MAPNSAPMAGSIRLTMSPAVTVTRIAAISSDSNATPAPVRSVVVDGEVMRDVLRTDNCNRCGYILGEKKAEAVPPRSAG